MGGAQHCQGGNKEEDFLAPPAESAHRGQGWHLAGNAHTAGFLSLFDEEGVRVPFISSLGDPFMDLSNDE